MRGAVLTRAMRPLLRARGQLRYATSSMRMPAMSPTMTEGGITGWKKQEGEAFSAGDVILEVETDKATIDVEAQDDGVLGKILVEAGSSKIPVGQIIAILAEEGDDLAAIEVPKNLGPEGEAGGQPTKKAEEPKKEQKEAQPQAPPKEEKKSNDGSGATASTSAGSSSGGHHRTVTHGKPLFPSVSRLLIESDLTQDQITKLKGTGRNGMLTKGDVLKAMGKIESPYGTAQKLFFDPMGASGKRASEATITTPPAAAKEPAKPLTAAELKRLIVQGMSKATQPAKPIVPSPTSLPLSSDAEFDAILSPYSSLLPPPQPAVRLPEPSILAEIESKGSPAPPSSKKDEWAGLF